MGFEPLDDLSTAGQENHDGVMMLFHEIGHKILADTIVDISQDPDALVETRTRVAQWQQVKCPREAKLCR